MSSAYYWPFVLLPVVLVAPGRYLTRGGDVVTVNTVSTRHDHGCRGVYPCGTPEGWHKSGRIYAGMLSANDIVSAAPPVEANASSNLLDVAVKGVAS